MPQVAPRRLLTHSIVCLSADTRVKMEGLRLEFHEMGLDDRMLKVKLYVIADVSFGNMV